MKRFIFLILILASSSVFAGSSVSIGVAGNALTVTGTDNVLYVSTSGTYSGIRGRIDKPFHTCVAAKNAASAGDLVIVHSGTYSEPNLLKNGVNWYFESGSTVDGDLSDNGLFDDSSFGANGAVICTISGAPTIAGSVGYLNVTNSASRIIVQATTFAGNPSLIQDAGYVSISANSLGAVLWTNGETHLNITDSIQGIVCTAASSANTQDFHATCGDLNVASIDGGNSAARFYLTCQKTQAASLTFDNARVYLTTQKLGYALILKQTGTASDYWVTAQKATGPASVLIGPIIQLRGGTSHIQIQDIDRSYPGIGTQLGLTCTGGNHRVTIGNIPDYGVSISSGTLALVNTHIDTRTTTQPAITKTGGTLILDDTRLLVTGTLSISATNAQNVTVVGNLAQTGTASGNVTYLLGGVVTTDTNVR